MTIITNKIDFDELEIRQYSLDKLSRNIKRKIHGLDTETLNGNCRLLADNCHNYTLTNDLDSCLDFLTERRFASAHNFFFNLNYDVNAIIKYLDRESLQELYDGGETNYKNINIFYIPKKLLRLTKNKRVYKFYDIAQFYNTSLEKAARKYLGLEKYIDPIDRAVLGTSADFWRDNEPAIIKYCINDCKLTQKLAVLLDKTVSGALTLHPDNYMSKAAICKEYARKSIDLPIIQTIPRGALKYAFNAYSGGRFEIIQKGSIRNCFLYDINSAYPYHIQNLLDINAGKWKFTKDLHERANYGFYRVKVLSHYNKIAPLHYMLGNRIISYPILEAELYLTKQELEAYEPYIDFEIVSGWEFYATEKIYPFKNYVQEFWKLKSAADKASYEYSLYKIMINSLYGAFYEKINRDGVWQTGKLFNPIYATLITALTRVQLYQKAMTAPRQVVGFATDSILFQNDPELKTNKKLGGWTCEADGDAIVLRGGIYRIASKIKNRGIRSIGGLNTPYGHFNNVFDYIQAKPFNQTYPIISNRPLSFIEVLIRHKTLDLSDINVFTDMTYNLDINKDDKRLWDGSFNCGIELFETQLDSEPLQITV